MPVDATPKGPNATSYVTLAEADAYFLDRYGAAKWNDSGVVDDDKNRAIITATNRLEQEEYRGAPTDVLNQRLKWPRSGTYTPDGVLYADGTVPRPVKEATYELADAVLAGGISLKDTGLEPFESVTVGPLSVKPRIGRRAGRLPEQVLRLLAHVRLGAVGPNVRLIRG